MNVIDFSKMLKPCPYCGKKDEMIFTPLERFVSCGGDDEKRGACVSVSCDRCDVTMYDCHSKTTDYETRLEMLLEKWNKRGAEQ